MSKYKFDLTKHVIDKKFEGGRRLLATAEQVPALHGMALSRIELKKGGVREPHWHPNANELTYCSKGRARITIFSPGNINDTFTLEQGSVVYFPKGYIHHIENIHDGESEFILAYDSGHPEDFDLSSCISSMSAHVLTSTFQTDPAVFKKILEHKGDAFISKQKKVAPASDIPVPNRHKLSLERLNAHIQAAGGNARTATQKTFPILDHLALFSLRINKDGVREPHWHPNTAELNYVVKGKARLTILEPNGHAETFELSEGQASIIPPAYFHHIENIGKEQLHMTVFFNSPLPEDIGLSGALGVYSNEVLASLFNLEPSLFAKIPKYFEDELVVSGGG